VLRTIALSMGFAGGVAYMLFLKYSSTQLQTNDIDDSDIELPDAAEINDFLARARERRRLICDLDRETEEGGPNSSSEKSPVLQKESSAHADEEKGPSGADAFLSKRSCYWPEKTFD
jgi:hypothetical protein